MAREASSRPDDIAFAGTECSKPKFDHDFVERFSEYVDSLARITVTGTLFNTNVELALAFVTWVGEQIDLFVRLLAKSSDRDLPS